jgi:BolA protein
MDRVELIRERIVQALNPARLEIIDDSHLHAGHAAARGAGHYTVKIVSDRFSGQPLIERHRMVYRAVADLMPHQIHALSISAITPEELQSPQTV